MLGGSGVSSCSVESGVSLVFQARELVIQVSQKIEMLRWAGLSDG